MGLEAFCECRRVGVAPGKVKALLEARELILRGDISGRFPLAALSNIAAHGNELVFRHGAETIALNLGPTVAPRWAAKMAAPPLSLAQKLGIGATSRVLIIGKLDDAALQEACKGRQTGLSAQATICIAVTPDEPSLARAIATHAQTPAGTILWIVHGKGQDAAFGENAVRSFMRANSYIDNKVSAVSDALTATRYALRRN